MSATIDSIGTDGKSVELKILDSISDALKETEVDSDILTPGIVVFRKYCAND